MNTWKVILATLVIFGAGVITGGLIIRYSDRGQSPPKTSPAEIQQHALATTNVSRDRLPTPMQVPLRKDFIDRLDKELKLKPAQREHIEKIISNGQEQAKRIWQQIEPDMNSVMTEARERIACELTPEQRMQFEELLKQRGKPKVDKSANTNAPPTSATNAAVFDSEAILCLFGIKAECLSSNAPIVSPSLLQSSDQKTPLRRQTEPGS